MTAASLERLMRYARTTRYAGAGSGGRGSGGGGGSGGGRGGRGSGDSRVDVAALMVGLAEKRYGRVSTYFGRIQLGFGLWLTEAGVEARDWSAA